LVEVAREELNPLQKFLFMGGTPCKAYGNNKELAASELWKKIEVSEEDLQNIDRIFPELELTTSRGKV